jgi:hypothetical protein
MVQCLRRYSADRLANTDAVNGLLRGLDRARATPGYTATFGPTLGGAGVSSVVVGSTATATTLVEEVCGSSGLGGPTASSGIRCDIRLRHVARGIQEQKFDQPCLSAEFVYLEFYQSISQ